MFGGTLQWEPRGKATVIRFETSATAFNHVAFINL